MLQKNRRAIQMLAIVTVSVLGYQNCGPTSSGSMYPAQESEEVVALGKATPFPMDVTLDQFAYMSCATPTAALNGETYFTFKMGAYRNAGLRLNQDGMNYLNKEVKDISLFSRVLQNTPANSGSILQLDIRSDNNLSTSAITGTNNFPGSSYDFLLDGLAKSWVTDALARARNQSFVKQVVDPYTKQTRKMQGQLLLYRDEGGMVGLRSAFTTANSGLLALTFTQSDGRGGGLPITPDNVAWEGQGRVTYGRGYRPVFASPRGSVEYNWNRKLVSGLAERRLEFDSFKMSAPVPWDCPESMQFMIVHPQDRNKQISVRHNSDTAASQVTFAVNDGGRPADLALIRNSLPQGVWDIDMANRLVVPAKPEQGVCYVNPSNTARQIQYDVTQTDCDSGNIPNPLAKTCAHFVSICLRR
jgi:hypothetical protein